MVGFRQRPLARAKCVSKDGKQETNGRKGRKKEGLGRQEVGQSYEIAKSDQPEKKRTSITENTPYLA